MNQYALLAGISRYKDDQISDLQFAAKDVLAFRDKLIDVLGFDEENVHVFTDEPGESFAGNNAVIGCFSRICRRLEPEDTFIFYFAGHGVEKPDGVYLMTANTESYSDALIKTTSIPVSVLRDELLKTPAANRVFIIDACRNDPEKGRGDSANKLTPAMSRDLIRAAESRPSDIAQPPCTGILFACATNERAYEWPDKSHGVFSYYLLEAIDQLGREHGEVDFGVLERMVKANVMNWCRANLNRDKMQRPWLETIGGVPIIGKKRRCAGIRPRPEKKPESSGFSDAKEPMQSDRQSRGFMGRFRIRMAGIQYIVIPGESVWLGRNSRRFSDNHIALSLPDISRRHGTIFAKNGKWFYQDADQCANGALVNGKLVRNAVELRDGDQLGFGRFADPDDSRPLHDRCGETIKVGIYPQKGAPCLKVTVISGNAWEIKDDRKRVYLLIGGGMRIGNGKNNAVFIDDPSILPDHMDIIVADGRYFIAAPGASGKILVNGLPVSGRHALQPGDRVKIGSTELLIEEIR